MSGAIDLGADCRIYLDTNVFVEMFERAGPVNKALTQMLALADDRGVPRFVTSELALAELLVKPIEQSRHDLIAVYDNITVSNPFLEVVPVGRKILADAAFASQKSIKLPDAIHLTTAAHAGCRYFLTADRRLKATAQVEILHLDDALSVALVEALKNAN